MRNRTYLGNEYWLAALVSLVTSIWLTTNPVRAQEGQVCATTAGISWVGDPVIDGVIERFPVLTSVDPSGFKTDARWNGATKLNLSYTNAMGTGTGAIPGKFLLGDSPSALYLGVVIQTDTNAFVGPSENDVVVIALSTDGSTANDWRIHIYPFKASQISQNFENVDPDVVTVWRNSAGWNTNPSGNLVTPAWVTAAHGNIKVAKSGNYWSLEIKIPKSTVQDSGINLPSGTTPFRLYANIISTSTLQNSTYIQDPWPRWSQSAIRQVSSPPYSIDRRTPVKEKQHAVTSIQISGGTATATISGTQDFNKDDTVIISGIAGYSGPYVITGVTASTFSFATPSGANSANGSGTATVPIWGTASLAQRQECTGITIDQGDIGVLGNNNALNTLINVYKPNSSTLSEGYPSNAAACVTQYNNNPNLHTLLGGTNTFIAKPKNTSSHIPNELSVTFRLSQFGISSSEQFKAIGSSVITPNIPLAGTTINPGSGEAKQTKQFDWLESCQYMLGNFYLGKPHQCLLVELDSKDPNARFLKRSVWRNMDFTTASTMQHSATIDTKGFGSPTPGPDHEMLLRVNSELQSFTKDKPLVTRETVDTANGNQSRRWLSMGSEEIAKDVAVQYPNGISEAMLWTAHGFLLNGNYLEIRGRQFREAQFVGGFGYVVGHNGTVQNWNADFGGPGVERVSAANGTFAIKIPPEASVTVQTTIEAHDPCQCGDWKCLIEKQQNASTQTNLFAGTLALFGTLSVGGFAFLGRRKRPDEYLLGKDKE